MTPERTIRFRLTLCALIGAAAAACDSTSAPPVPAAAYAVVGDAQSGVAGMVLAIRPTIRVEDARGRGVPGVPVTFAILEGGGTIELDSIATDRDGQASPGAWTLGAHVGANVLLATAAGLTPVQFNAVSSPGEPALLRVHAGDAQSVTVGKRVTVPPTVLVLDANGNPVPDAPVTFTVVAGDGDVTGPDGTTPASLVTVETDDTGTARLGGWRLGTHPGENMLEAGIAGFGTVVRFAASAAPGPAHAVEIVAGDGQSASVGSRLPVAPAVRVTDEWGNAVPGLLVTFAITGGGGALAGSIKTTGTDGIAAVDSWDLGSAPGPNGLSATPAGLASVNFNADGTSSGGGSTGSGGGGATPGGFSVQLRYTTSISSSQAAAFNAAADRWSSVITGDLPDVFVSIAANGCGAPHPAINETIDDVVIFITVTSIDGPGKVLGSAGPCRVRSNGLPAVGIIYLDADDLGSLLTSGLLTDVVIHEMGHVLGIGTLWPPTLVTGSGGADPIFSGAAAVAEFAAAGGYSYAGTPVPIENTGGAGTRDAHWREAVMTNEIMTGWINYGGNPMSGVTIGSLADLGYQVDMNAADSWMTTGVSVLQAGAAHGFEVHEGVLPPPIVVGAGADAASAKAASGSSQH